MNLTAGGTVTSWKSSDSSVVSVDASGKITALAEGTATVTVTGSDGSTATCFITVTNDKTPLVDAIAAAKTALEGVSGIDKTADKVISGKKAKPAADYHATVNRNIKDEIDLRGMNGDEAWFAVDKYLDSAILYGFRTVRIIHGKGTGALRQAMQNFLRTDKRVASFRRGQYGEGDSGVTVVELK